MDGGFLMELQKRLEILAAGARYDASCSSSGSTRKNQPGGLGNAAACGICHSWSDDGRCISLLKILLSNQCIYDCVYCINRVSNDVPRTALTPREVAELTVNFYRRNYIEGLFLSSAVVKNPHYTMELLIEAVKLLRIEYRFNGYIHMKGIPGASNELIAEAGRYVDRMSVNIELPSNQSLKLLAPQKKKEAILKPMGLIHQTIGQAQEERKRFRHAPSFVPAGQSTQLIVGATPDDDLHILRLSEGLYHRYDLKRVYYSAYVPVVTHPKLPTFENPPTLREHRLYQADWLLRFYGFTAGELLNEARPNFDIALDPKTDWALRSLGEFPVEVNRADYETLLRVPGIGVLSAKRIVAARRLAPLTYDGLKKIGVVLKRAQYFITCQGKYYGQVGMNEGLIRQSLLGNQIVSPFSAMKGEQLSLFNDWGLQQEAHYSVVTGDF